MFYIYKIINKINNKLYIGKTNDPYTRWHAHRSVATLGATNEFYYQSGHYSLIQRAISKYNVDNFEFTIIEENEEEKYILEREKYWIAYYKTNVCKYGNQYEYNLTDGGEGTSGKKHTKEAKQKIKEKATGRVHSQETKEKMSKARSGEGCGHNILTKEQIPIIINLRQEGMSYPQIGKIFGVSKTTIRKVCTGKTWKNI